jgi:hypothetical protein
MPVNVGSVQSEVSVEEERQQGGAAYSQASWEELERVRSAQARLRTDRLRTAAEGFDD